MRQKFLSIERNYMKKLFLLSLLFASLHMEAYDGRDMAIACSMVGTASFAAGAFSMWGYWYMRNQQSQEDIDKLVRRKDRLLQKQDELSQEKRALGREKSQLRKILENQFGWKSEATSS